MHWTVFLLCLQGPNRKPWHAQVEVSEWGIINGLFEDTQVWLGETTGMMKPLGVWKNREDLRTISPEGTKKETIMGTQQ